MPDTQPAISCHTLDGIHPLSYFLFKPPGGIQDGRVLVSVHGISRNAREHVELFSPLAEQTGTAIIAPLFPEADFPRYQRLGTNAHEERADLAFDQILKAAVADLGVDPFPLRLFGFSGGGQFSHRYALLYPGRVRSMVLGAPGWYTFPDTAEHFPYGLRNGPDWPKIRLTLEPFLQIPTLVMVGEQDNIRDDDMNCARRIDARQGVNRFERGERWVQVMNSHARAYGFLPGFRFESVPNASHAFESYVAHPHFCRRVFEYLFAEN